MIEQCQSDFKSLKAFAIGGQPKDRAALCYSASNSQLAIEPLDCVDELTAADLVAGDAFFVCGDEQLIEDLKVRLARAQIFAPIIAFSEQASVDDVIRAFEAGASSFVETPFSSEKIVKAIEAATRKSHFLGTHSQRAIAANFRMRCLSGREREVLELVSDGLSNKLIGKHLSISPRTVEIHRANAFAKLGIAHTAEAVRLVLEAHFYDSLRGPPDRRLACQGSSTPGA